MRPDLLEVLRCPVCRSELRLATGTVEGEEILEGTLTCTGCHVVYPISDGIPDLLPPEDRD
ncbi:MAG: methytransferase partner Trm112 [Thermoplasmata archaeon]|nr:methytransferase partner Trm112 [Thermoplasmata archaeon]